MPLPTPPQPDPTPTDLLHGLPMAYQWKLCPRHAFLRLSVVVTAGAPDWCIGDGDVRGHWVEQVAA